jgi:hypothetical protein
LPVLIQVRPINTVGRRGAIVRCGQVGTIDARSFQSRFSTQFSYNLNPGAGLDVVGPQVFGWSGRHPFWTSTLRSSKGFLGPLGSCRNSFSLGAIFTKGIAQSAPLPIAVGRRGGDF